MAVLLMMISAEHLSFRFADRLILSDASFEIPAGSITGVFGPSGCGKSTLAKLLCGIYRPEQGQIFLEDALLASPKGYDRKAGLQIQMVYQQPFSALDPAQKLGAGFRELIGYHHLAPDRASADALTLSLLREVGLGTDILGHRPHQISGGEAQRISIARCLLFAPKLLILDEATSMLDVSTQANVLGLVRRSMEKTGGSVLLISHDRALTNALCQRVYVFRNSVLEVSEP